VNIIKNSLENPPNPLYQGGTKENLSLYKEEEQNFPLDKGGQRGISSYKDNLILYRTNAQSRVIEEALLRENIPYRVV
jgi:DNA helicase-2/ATP-dependent DNA helicase PcrA